MRILIVTRDPFKIKRDKMLDNTRDCESIAGRIINSSLSVHISKIYLHGLISFRRRS